MTLTPAYGRDYKSKKEVLADFDAGKDFMAISVTSGSGYINKEGLKQINVNEVNIRYKKLTQVLVHNF